MANKKFLEEYPLYKDFKTNKTWFKNQSIVLKANNLSKPAINMNCSSCESMQTFNMNNEYHKEHSNEPILGQVKDLRYLCSSCQNSMYVFLVHFFSEEIGGDSEEFVLIVNKVGQVPAWDIEIDEEFEKMLGDHVQHYKSGLICESQSYGIGAYAYFRRVVEDVIDELLKSISGLVEENEKKEYKKKLEEVKQEKIAENKIKIVQDLLPSSLQVEGMNPLKQLYSVLSDGVHNKTDEECMNDAEAIKNILIFLVNQINRTERDRENFKKNIKKIT
jgi:hypothetical protein